MDLLRAGRSMRALRIKRGLRQLDVAARAGVSRTKVARIERGEVGRLPIGDFGRVAASLGADVELRVRWRGEGLDRLLDAAHAALVERTVVLLRSDRWEVEIEVSFNVDGERGSIDILARHPDTGALLTVEVKSVMPDAQSLLASLNRKARLARRIARDGGWTPTVEGRLLVIVDGSTARRRTALLGATFRSAFPVRGRAVRDWLRRPVGPMSGLLFLPYDHGVTRSQGPATRQRVRRPRVAVDGARDVVRP